MQQTPLRHCPPGQAVPSLLSLMLQVPVEQLADLQGSLVEQVEQLAPLSPQVLVVVPTLQLEPVQQPVQQEPL